MFHCDPFRASLVRCATKATMPHFNANINEEQSGDQNVLIFFNGRQLYTRRALPSKSSSVGADYLKLIGVETDPV